MEFPRIYLAIDNCFASKRWTDPYEWISLIKDMGVAFVEVSADNECDPLYMGSEYMNGWIEKVKAASAATGVKVANLYSGHGTYATLGLAHTESKIRDRFLNEWLKAMADTAGQLSAGMGFFCHAFANSVLQDIGYYEQMRYELSVRLASLANIAAESNCKGIGVEQMYTPHQIPWTIKGAFRLLEEVNRLAQSPLYITIDTGHQSGQVKFLRPTYEDIKTLIEKCGCGRIPDNIWMGPQAAWELFEKAVTTVAPDADAVIKAIEAEMDRYPYMFASSEDGDTYSWLEQLGCYSPIIHLQQTSGRSSSHWPFTQEFNEKGIITGDRVLKAIEYSYAGNFKRTGLPAKCKEIYLTLEIFSGTADMNHDIVRRLKESVSYWRNFIPDDGLPLNNLTKEWKGAKNENRHQ